MDEEKNSIKLPNPSIYRGYVYLHHEDAGTYKIHCLNHPFVIEGDSKERNERFFRIWVDEQINKKLQEPI